jgi:PKD repeat protein
LPVPLVSINAIGTSLSYCQGDTIYFQANPVSAGTNPIYVWRVNGQVVQSGPNLPVFSSTGLNNGDIVGLALVVSNACVTGDTILSNDLAVNIFPLPTFTAPQCQVITAVNGQFAPGQPLLLEGNSGGNNANYQFFWNFGNGTGALGQQVYAVYPQAGTYTVELSIQDANGCVSAPGSCTGTVTIQAVPTAAFSANAFAGCAPFTVNFTNQSQNAVTYLWTFGDGTPPVTSPSPTHTFTAAGTYTVKLKVFSTGGNDSSTVTQAVTVHPTPSADFVAIPTTVITASDSVYFTHTAVGANSWQWNFGDPASGPNNTATGPSVAHFYANEGTYTVTLIVSNDFGCRDTIIKVNYVTKEVLIGAADLNYGLGAVQVYPNPFGSELNLRLNAQQAGLLDASLLSLTGQQVASFARANVPSGASELNLATPAGLAPGVYLLRLGFQGHTHHIKVIYTGQ